MNSIPSGLVYMYGKGRSAFSRKPGFQISILPKEKALWYRVLKAGTRSLNQYFTDHAEGYHYFSKDVLLNPFYQDWFKFAIIQNPLERTRSVWRQKILGGLGPELFGLKESEDEKLHGFNELVRWLGDQNLDFGEFHIRKKSALIPAEEMDFIGTMGNLQEDMVTIKSELGPYFLSCLMKTKRIAPNRIRAKIMRTYFELSLGGRRVMENQNEKRKAVKGFCNAGGFRRQFGCLNLKKRLSSDG